MLCGGPCAALVVTSIVSRGTKGNACVPWPPGKCSRETGSGQNQEQSSGHLHPSPLLWPAVCQTCFDFLQNLPVQFTLYHVATLSNKNGLLLSFFPVLHAYMHIGVMQSFRRLTPGILWGTCCRAPV